MLTADVLPLGNLDLAQSGKAHCSTWSAVDFWCYFHCQLQLKCVFTVCCFTTLAHLYFLVISWSNICCWDLCICTSLGQELSMCLSGNKSTYQWRRHRRLMFNPWVGKILWSKKWQPTPVSLPGKFQGKKSQACYPWGSKEMLLRMCSLGHMGSAITQSSGGTKILRSCFLPT